MTPPATGWKQWLLMFVGHASVGLAIAGAFLPLLPTTPFLLLASYCYLRSSPAAYERLIHHPVLGAFLRDWQRHRAVRRSVKRTALLTLLGVMAGTAWVSRFVPLVQCFSLLGCAAGLVVILRLPVIAEPVLDTKPLNSADSPGNSA